MPLLILGHPFKHGWEYGGNTGGEARGYGVATRSTGNAKPEVRSGVALCL